MRQGEFSDRSMPPGGSEVEVPGTCRAREVYIVKGSYTTYNYGNAVHPRLFRHFFRAQTEMLIKNAYADSVT